MKRVFALLLLVLLLCGCTAETPEETTDTTGETLPAVEPTEPPGSYEPDSAMEAATGGAVRVYSPDIADAYALAVMGGDLVVFSGTENTTLTKLTGENRYVTASVSLDTWVDLIAPSVRVTEKGISYYDSDTCELVLLGTGLKEISRVDLPEDMVGEPVISADRKQVYYCTEHCAWVLTLETGISRMIKEISEPFTTACGLLLNDTVLQCGLDGDKQMFLSTETGKTLWQGSDDITVTGAGANWYAVVPEGLIDAYVFGAGENQEQMLLLESLDGVGCYLETDNWLVGLFHEESGSRLDCYDLTVGNCVSSLIVENIPLGIVGDGAGLTWVMTAEGLLYRWDVAAMPTDDETVYTTPRYTLDNPDEDGYARCAARAEEIESRYGVEILFGREAVAVQSPDYDLTGEYMVPVLMRELEKLDELLAVYPEEMLKAAVMDTTGGTLYICLVREVAGSAAFGILDAVGGTQFWEGDDTYVVLAVGQEDGSELYHQMYHVMEPRLMSNSNACYEWDSMNPKDFAYDYSYVLNQTREDDGYLEGDNRYFIDTHSMSFPREDRATILEYAMMDGNEEYFASPAMQAKLKALCVGIREAYGLKRSPETYLWEQYLAKSLAYTK